MGLECLKYHYFIIALFPKRGKYCLCNCNNCPVFTLVLTGSVQYSALLSCVWNKESRFFFSAIPNIGSSIIYWEAEKYMGVEGALLTYLACYKLFLLLWLWQYVLFVLHRIWSFQKYARLVVCQVQKRFQAHVVARWLVTFSRKILM